MLNRKLGIKMVLLLLVLVSGIVTYKRLGRRQEHYLYEQSQEVICNPYIGFAPSADYVDAVGDNTLVYVEVTFKELEPEQGVFDFEGIEEKNYLHKWETEGKHVVFRLVCDKPTDEPHRDIPDWLYEMTGDGKVYDMEYGKGYAPDYSNPILIEEHAKAIKALGEHFGKDDFFYYIEFGSLGHWGEWHVKVTEDIPLLPGKEICELYVKPYLEAFPNAHFLMRRPFDLTEQEFGVFNDMTGDEDSTKTWLEWISQGGIYTEPIEPIILRKMPEIWNRQPVGGEFTSSDSMVNMLTMKSEQTISLLDASHMSFIGPKCPVACDEQKQYPKEVENILQHVGYRFGVSEADIHYDWKKHVADVSIMFCNYGVAPMYEDWQVCLYLVDVRDGNILERVPTTISTKSIYSGEKKRYCSKIASGTISRNHIENGNIVLAIGIEDPQSKEAKIQLDMNVKHIGKMYVLN